jgi:nucleoside-diphosphate-sugar epimerase
LIGHTGFIGSNLARQFDFDESYHSPTIAGIRNREFDLLVCCGVTAVKWWANQNPVEDRARIDALLHHLAAVQAGHVTVISTVDVYPVNSGADESFDCHSRPNHIYGTNRLHFEDALRSLFRRVTTVRIGGVFGPGLKKNVVYDLLHDNCLDAINPRSSFQYYNVTHLWRYLQLVEAAGAGLANLVTEPVCTGELIGRFFPGKRVGSRPAPEIHYDIRTRYSREWGGPPGYLASSGDVLGEIGQFVESFRKGEDA